MLVLKRSEGEAIVFPELGITIRLFDCQHGNVKVGVQAPRRVTVHREEVQREIEKQLREESERMTA